MKKMMILVVMIALAFLNLNCNDVVGGDTNNYFPDNGGANNGNTAEVQTGVSFMFRAVSSYGKVGNLSIMQLKDGYLYSVSSEEITITNDQVYRPLEPGEYYAQISSYLDEFGGYTHFFVQEGEVSGIYIDIQEHTLVNLYTVISDDSPGDTTTVGLDVPVFDFGAIQDYFNPLALSVLGFRVDASPGVQIEKAHLYYLTLAGWNEIAVPCSNYCDLSGCYNYFELTLDPLTPMVPNYWNWYSLTLDITDANPGDTLQAGLVYVGGWSPTDSNVRFRPHTFAQGHTLRF